MNRKDRKLAIAVIGALGLAAVAPAAWAQQPAPAAKERIEVTGSNIKRVKGETALPVTVITREEIDKSGATNAVELLQLVASNNSFGNATYTSTLGATTVSANTAALRGLTGGRTLILIHGKRVNGFAGEINGVQGVNLSVIPFAAIERVEILKDGASAVYGSDAIAGVINFIVRTDYRGAEATVFYGAPTRSGGGEQEKYSGAIGFGDLATQRFNAWQAYGTALYTEDENRFKIQPVPISRVFFYGPNSDIPATVTILPSSPFYPTALAASHGVAGQPLDVRFRAYEAGQRDTTDTNKGGQVVAGVKGSWGTWDLDGSYTYAQGKTKEQLNGGFPLYSPPPPLLNRGRVNLFGPNTPALV